MAAGVAVGAKNGKRLFTGGSRTQGCHQFGAARAATGAAIFPLPTAPPNRAASARRRAAQSTASSQALHPPWRPDAMGEVQSRQSVATPAAQTLAAELDRIAALGLDEVRALWREMTQQNAPKALSRDLLARMIAYRVQEQRLTRP